MKAVSATRTIDVSVSRLRPVTAVGEVNVIKGNSLPAHYVQCVKLMACYEHLYSAFHVQMHVCSSDIKHALMLYMASDSRPNGVFVRRYFPYKVAMCKNKLSICTYNCRDAKSRPSLPEMQLLYETHDFVCLRQNWFVPYFPNLI